MPWCFTFEGYSSGNSIKTLYTPPSQSVSLFPGIPISQVIISVELSAFLIGLAWKPGGCSFLQFFLSSVRRPMAIPLIFRYFLVPSKFTCSIVKWGGNSTLFDDRRPPWTQYRSVALSQCSEFFKVEDLLVIGYVSCPSHDKQGSRQRQQCTGAAGYRDSREKGIRNPVDPVYWSSLLKAVLKVR